jgi:hypothetical protein
VEAVAEAAAAVEAAEWAVVVMPVWVAVEAPAAR